MSDTTLTLALRGDVPLNEFAESMQRFQRLVNLLTQEVSRDTGVVWTIEDLSGGSATATIRGDAPEIEDVVRIVRAYETVGRALERHDVIPYSPQIGGAARSITQVLNGRITSIDFETPSDVATVTTDRAEQGRPNLLRAFGAVEGRIETLTTRRRLSFTLYDSLNDRPIRCYLRPDQSDIVRDAWGRRAIVEGWIKRESDAGRAESIFPVQSIEILPEVQSGSYRRARAIAPADPGESSPEVVIRRLRDA